MSTVTLTTDHPRRPLPELTAADVMATRAHVRNGDESVATAVELLQRGHSRHIVVCSAEGHVLGVLDDRRLAKLVGRPSWDDLSQPLSRCMDRAVCRCAGTDRLPHVARLLESSGSDAVVVTDAEGRYAGLITPAEVVRAVAQQG